MLKYGFEFGVTQKKSLLRIKLGMLKVKGKCAPNRRAGTLEPGNPHSSENFFALAANIL